MKNFFESVKKNLKGNTFYYIYLPAEIFITVYIEMSHRSRKTIVICNAFAFNLWIPISINDSFFWKICDYCEKWIMYTAVKKSVERDTCKTGFKI